MNPSPLPAIENFLRFFFLPFCFLGSDLRNGGCGWGREGLAGTHDSWGPQIKGLTGSLEPAADDEESGDAAAAEGDDGDGIEVCCFDNRGVGRSSVLPHKSYYS